ncbi:hypothetical protein ACOALZ_08810 [Nocardiopsis algeriensis]|uniref:hypothetical protein n=1 Tax=Nocardiopsis algeriensis TaxID=1478215 RepID=UPI003B433B3A
MKTSLPAMIAAGALALSLTACGSDTPDETTEAPVEATEAAGDSLSDLLGSLTENTREVTSYTFELEGTAQDATEGETSISMTYAVMDDPAAVQVSVYMPEIGEAMAGLLALGGGLPEGVTEEELSTTTVLIPEGQEALIANPYGFYGESPWVRDGDSGTASDITGAFDVNQLPLITDVFAGLEQAEEAGEEQIDGVDTTIVAGILTSAEFEALSAEERSAVSAVFLPTPGEDVPCRLWVSEDGFPMRIEFADSASQAWIEFSSVGSTSFEVPADDQIGDLVA